MIRSWRPSLAAALLYSAVLFPVTLEAGLLKKCTVVAAAAVIGAGGWYYGASAPQPSMELEVPNTASVSRSESQWRAERFTRLMKEGELSRGINNDQGQPPKFVVFTRNLAQVFVAGKLKEELIKRYPELATDPAMKEKGVPLSLTKLTLKEDPDHPDRVFLSVGGRIAQLKSAHSISKEDLLSGKTLPVEFAPLREPTEKNGTFTVEAKLAVSYDADKEQLKVTSGRFGVAIKIPEVVDEEHRVEVPAFHVELRLP